jgi:hypothetical protein
MRKIGRTKGQLWKRTVMRDSDVMISNGGVGELMRGIEVVVMFGGVKSLFAMRSVQCKYGNRVCFESTHA